jgi:hypothetical protein
MKTLLLSIILIISSNIIGQVTGIYKGLDHYATYKNDKGEEYKRYNDKQLTLNEDSSFQYWSTYEKFTGACWGCSDTLWVTGTWTKSKDTILLYSKYKVDDFISINEFKTKGDQRTFIYNTPYNCHTADLLVINDSINIDFNCWTTIIKELKTINSIKFKKYIGHTLLYEFDYKPHPYYSNIFTFNFDHTKRDMYNYSFFENVRLIIKDDILYPITNDGLIEVEDGYKN